MTLKALTEGEKSATFVFAENASEVSKAINDAFITAGYKLESGTPENAVYGIGNDTLRLIFGAFVKRYKFNIIVSTAETGTSVEFAKAMTGAMGGAIGYVKMNTEFKNWVLKLKSL